MLRCSLTRYFECSVYSVGKYATKQQLASHCLDTRVLYVVCRQSLRVRTYSIDRHWHPCLLAVTFHQQIIAQLASYLIYTIITYLLKALHFCE